jgi:hypothetical protein
VERDDTGKEWLWFGGLFILYVALWIGYGYLIWERLFVVDTNVLGGTAAGIFGDMYGAFNAFFSGLAFLCLFFALLMQRRELRPGLKNGQRITVCGLVYASYREAAHAHGLTPQIVSKRLKAGWSIDDAFTTPRRKVTYSPESRERLRRPASKRRPRFVD